MLSQTRTYQGNDGKDQIGYQYESVSVETGKVGKGAHLNAGLDGKFWAGK